MEFWFCGVWEVRDPQGSGNCEGMESLPRVLGFLWKMEESMLSLPDPRFRVYLGARGPLGLRALCRKYVSVGSLGS